MKTTKKGTNQMLLTYRETADMLGISEQHLFRLNAGGKRLPAPIRLGKSIRWSKQELQDWLAAGGPPRAEWEKIKGEERNNG